MTRESSGEQELWRKRWYGDDELQSTRILMKAIKADGSYPSAYENENVTAGGNCQLMSVAVFSDT